MDLTRRLRGEQIAGVLSNGHILVLQTASGAEIQVAWVDDNGEPIKGKPVIRGVGVRLRAEGMREIMGLAPGSVRAVGA